MDNLKHLYILNNSDTIETSIQTQNFETVSGFSFSIWDLKKIEIDKKYDFSQGNYYARYFGLYDDLTCEYINVISGYVKFLKYDIENRVIAGTFEFTAGSAECPDTVRVTEGRFDIGEITRY